MYKMIYIAGPVSGMPECNRPAFIEADKMLRDAGFRVCNPAYIGDEVFFHFGKRKLVPGWSDFMRACIPGLAKCDAIYMLPGWIKSRGAKWERIIAKYVFDMPVYKSIDDIPK